MTTLTITGGLTTIPIARTPEAYAAGAPYWIEAEDGLGMADVRRLEERGPLQHGVTDVGYRLEPRNFSLILGFQAADLADFYARRDALLRLLRPARAPLALLWELDNGQRRAILANVTSGPRWSSQERLGLRQKAGVTLRAPDPLFFDPTGVSAVYGVGAGGDAWTVPWSIPWGVGAAAVAGSRAILNPGSFDALPTIVVQGPITDLKIVNETTDETLDFTGYSLSTGQTLAIDTRYGLKTVAREDGSSQLDKLSDASDLATFHLGADPDAPGGTNTITVTGSGATTATEVYLQFQPRYVGM